MLKRLKLKKIGKEHAIKSLVGAISVGTFKDMLLMDLNYHEDSNAQADVNIVMNENFDLIEVQGTAEDKPISKSDFNFCLSIRGFFWRYCSLKDKLWSGIFRIF